MKAVADSELLIPADVQDYYRTQEGDDYDPEATQVLFVIRALAQRVNDVSWTWLEPFGLTPLSYQALVRLQAAPAHALALSAISKSLHTRATTITSLVDGLERDGIVRRIPHPTDRRATLAKLTAKGSRLATKATVSQHKHIAKTMTSISRADRETIVRVALQIADGLQREKARLREHRTADPVAPVDAPRARRATARA